MRIRNGVRLPFVTVKSGSGWKAQRLEEHQLRATLEAHGDSEADVRLWRRGPEELAQGRG